MMLLSCVSAPVGLWHGELDEITPLAMGGWLGAMLPHVMVHIGPDDGHLGTIFGRRDTALDWLLD